MPRFNPPRELWVNLTRAELIALAKSRAGKPIRYGVSGGRSWSGSDYMPGKGWHSERVGEPHFEIREVAWVGDGD